MKQADRNALVGTIIAVVMGALIALAGSQESIRFGEFPVFAIAVGLAYLIQWIVFVPSYVNKTEQFYDLTGSISYITITMLALMLRTNFDLRSVLVSLFVLVWAIRLGSFLFARVRKAGEDKRFRELKQSFLRFLQTWTLQGLWIAFTLAAALAVITSRKSVPFDTFGGAGSIIWMIGFIIEVVADNQKKQFKNDPHNEGKFIQSGLWGWSRHPNYFGEIVLWVGIAIMALPVLRGWQWVTLLSPIFVTLLLTKISGVPILEKRADEKWGHLEEYGVYKENISLLLPLPPKKKN